MDEAGIGRFQKGEVRAHVDDLKPAPAPAPQPGKPPLLPLYFSGHDVGDKWIIFSFFFSSFFLSLLFFFVIFLSLDQQGPSRKKPKTLELNLQNFRTIFKKKNQPLVISFSTVLHPVSTSNHFCIFIGSYGNLWKEL